MYKEAETSHNFMTLHCSRHYNYRMLPARMVNHHFILILTSTSLPYKRLSRYENKKEPKN